MATVFRKEISGMDEDDPGLIETIRRHWLALALFAALVAGGAIFIEWRSAGDDDATAPVSETAPSPSPTTQTEGKGSDATPGASSNPADNLAAAVMSQAVAVEARPAVLIRGQGKWEDSSKTISEALDRLRDAASRAGLAVNGRPIAVFTKSDDAGFTFEAMLPLAAAPEGKPKLGDGVEIGASPGGKTLKFQHRGAYDEIEATYEAIAAFLDEKGLDTKDLIIEEYLSDFKGDDASVDVDIYVFLK
jgi:effector-binding domain-containing protein